ncbi:hypothetical protein F5880DRAFT_1632135 [Lentinula raphanica]|nr:hypothetical protein F5880DRAFT_1632135 [Lentinula raphanica]
MELMRDKLPNLSHVVDVSLNKLHEYINKARTTRIYVLAMVINPTVKLDWIRNTWLSRDEDHARQWVKEAMLKYRETMSSTRTFAGPISRRSVAGAVSSAVHAQGAGMLAMHQLKQNLSRTTSRSSLSSAASSAFSSQESLGSENPLSHEELVEEELQNWLQAGVIKDPHELKSTQWMTSRKVNRQKISVLKISQTLSEHGITAACPPQSKFQICGLATPL